jgi:hypothetical protein
VKSYTAVNLFGISGAAVEISLTEKEKERVELFEKAAITAY